MNILKPPFITKEDSVPEERERTGEFKASDRKNTIKLFPYERLRKDFFDKIAKTYKPDILGVTANSIEFEKFEELIDGIEVIKPKPFVIIGGVHPTVAPEEVIKNLFIDALCRGEGEKAWEEFLVRFINNRGSFKYKKYVDKNQVRA